MEERSPLTDRILHLTLEIIHLLTGEKCAVVKMASIEGLLQGMYPPVSGERSRSPSMDPPPPSMTSERNNDGKILEVTQKIMELLTGEALLEECRSAWKKVTMENHQNLTSSDVSGRAKTPPTSSTMKVESYPSKEQNLSEGDVSIEADYTMMNVKEEKKKNVKEEDLLDEGCGAPRTLPLVDTMEVSSGNISGVKRCHSEEERGVYDLRTGCTEDKGDSSEQHRQVDSMSLWVKDGGVTGDPLTMFGGEFNETGQPGAPYWPPSMSSETYSFDGCKQRFTSSPHFPHHQPPCQGPPPLFCSECGKFFDRREQLVRHRRIHVGPKRYTCLQCDKSFCKKSQLALHWKVHTGEKSFSCTVCGKCFSRQQILANHMATHSGERPYVCSECGRSFSRNSLLTIHWRIHSGEKPYSCSECNKPFRHKTALVTHLRTHTGERPYHCLVCGKSYTHRSHLVVHQRSHSGEKPYSCLECGKSFASKSVLVRHQQIHTAERP